MKVFFVVKSYHITSKRFIFGKRFVFQTYLIKRWTPLNNLNTKFLLQMFEARWSAILCMTFLTYQKNVVQ